MKIDPYGGNYLKSTGKWEIGVANKLFHAVRSLYKATILLH